MPEATVTSTAVTPHDEVSLSSMKATSSPSIPSPSDRDSTMVSASGPTDKVSHWQALVLGLQHVLAMDIYVVPFIIAGALALAPTDASAMIQSTFLAAGYC